MIHAMRMPEPHSHIFSVFLVLTLILMSASSISSHAAVGPTQTGILSPHQVLNDWCTNLTQHLNTTLEKFGSITFNRAMANSNISSSGITVLQRLKFDLDHLKIYSLLFGQIPSSITEQKFNLCVNNGTTLMGGLLFGMEGTELFLNGSVPYPPQFIRRGATGSQTRYQDLNHEIADLKSHLRGLVIILGSNNFTPVQVASR